MICLLACGVRVSRPAAEAAFCRGTMRKEMAGSSPAMTKSKWSGNLRRPERPRGPVGPRTRRLFGDAADAFAAHEFSPDFLWRDTGRNPNDDQVIQHVGALGDHGVAVAAHRFDQAFQDRKSKRLNSSHIPL